MEYVKKPLLLFAGIMLLVYGAVIAMEHTGMAISLAIAAGYMFYCAGKV